jgi:uncharacterized caspase-like protein
MRLRLITLVATLLFVGGALTAQDRRLVRTGTAERRFALVVGNDAYTTTPLRNAVADARAMARVLQDELGFAVDLITDARLDAFEARLDQFMRQLLPGDIALFYYSGHGVEIAGENYLLPVDFTMPDQQVQVKRRSVSALEVLERMGERGVRVRLVILDACRDNPFRGTRSGASGLVRMDAQGALVAFATAPGKTASDNPGGANGLFTRELLTALRVPGLTVPEVFRRVRARVNEATGGQQFPWLSDGLVGDLVLLPASAVPTAVSPLLPAGVRMAFVDMQTVVNESKLGKAGQAQLKALIDGGAATAQQQALNDRLLNEFAQKVLPVVDQIRTQMGLWAVLANHETGVAALQPGLDLSAEIARRLDAADATAPVGAPGSGSAPLPGAKIAFVHTQTLINDSKLGKAGVAQVKALVDGGATAAQQQALNDKLQKEFEQQVIPIVERVRSQMGLWAIFAADETTPIVVHPSVNVSAEVVRQLDAAESSPSAVAQPASTVFPSEAKMAFVNLQAVVDQSKLGKAGQAQMKALVDRGASSKETDALQERLKNDLEQRVMPILEQIRTQRSLWVVFAGDQTRLVALHPGLDLTAEVVRGLDAVTSDIRH